MKLLFEKAEDIRIYRIGNRFFVISRIVSFKIYRYFFREESFFVVGDFGENVRNVEIE